MRRPIAAAVALIAATPALPAPREPPSTKLEATYAVTLAGLPLGRATLRLDVAGGNRYEAVLDAALKGLAGVLIGGEGKATSRGRLDGPLPRPRFFALDARYSGTPLVERMASDDGDIGRVDITPKPMDRPDRVPAGPRDRKGVVDPVAGLVGRRLARDGTLDASECARTVPVHDGTTRFDVVLSPVPALAPGPAAVPGPQVVCAVRYVPISGHRPTGWAVKAMSENKDVRVWLAEVGSTGVLAPARISVSTPLGSAVAEAVGWTVKGPPGAR